MSKVDIYSPDRDLLNKKMFQLEQDISDAQHHELFTVYPYKTTSDIYKTRPLYNSNILVLYKGRQ